MNFSDIFSYCEIFPIRKMLGKGVREGSSNDGADCAGSSRLQCGEVPEALRPDAQRGVMQTLYGRGASVRPKRPCMGGGWCPAGRRKLKACIRLENIRNSSIFASCSPIHTLRPAEGREELQTLTFTPISSTSWTIRPFNTRTRPLQSRKGSLMS